ncbi:MAG: molybdate ABC transporter substrate-binding protein [Acetobacter sp.]|uniref:molybdate ABC transporter substrate-binding protein n=1 Tax=Acetobacter sp. TaxID=440 RepID=UPI003D05E23E
MQPRARKTPSSRPCRLLFSVLAVTLAPAVAHAEQARIAIAANFIGPAKELIAAYTKKTGDTITPSFGSSGQFVVQIEHGAGYDAFLSADEAKPARLIQDGYGVQASRFTYAIGKLALWSPTPNLPASEATLRAASFQHIALCNPDLAPYGAAAVAALKALDVYQSLQPRFVMGMDIAQAYQFVQSGNAELGFVALSQLHAHPVGTVWLLPQFLYPPIRQDAVLLTNGAHNHAAQAFLSYLKSPEALTIITAYGYATP